MKVWGIRYQEVFDAADALEQQGQTPTIDKVRAALGHTGSNSTISKYLNLWRQQIHSPINENDAKTPVRTTTPDIVKAAVERVWQDMRQQTDAEIEATKIEAERIQLESNKKVQEAQSMAELLKSELQQVRELYHAEMAEKELLKLDLKSLREEHALLMERFKGLSERHAETQLLSKMNLEKLADTHQQELLRLETSQQEQLKNLQQWIDTLKEHEKDHHEYIVKENALKVEHQKLADLWQKLKIQLENTCIENQNLKKQLKATETEYGRLFDHLDNQQEKTKAFADQLSLSNNLLEKIQSTAISQEFLSNLISKVSISINNNFSTLEEKLAQNLYQSLRKKKEALHE